MASLYTTLYTVFDDYLLPDTDTMNDLFVDDLSRELNATSDEEADDFDWQHAIH